MIHLNRSSRQQIELSAEAREKLRNFQGKSGFGSSDYYGRDESGGPPRNGGGGSGPTAEHMVAAVSESAKDFANKFVGQAAEDLTSLKKIVGVGTAKLGDFLQDIQVCY